MPSYHYSPLPEGSVRLLRILPHPNAGSYMQCTLSTHPLLGSEASHPYEALSYTWGSERSPQPILLDGCEFVVGANLHAALSNLCDRFIERVIWVDAICINQEDMTEKGHQVECMAQIYAKASRVVVWLGEPMVDGDRALEQIHMVANQQSTALQIDKQAIFNLLERPWFQRIWVLQEVAAARHVQIKCGSIEIDGYAFCLGLDMLKPLYSANQALSSLLPPIAWLIKEAIFRPGHKPVQSKFSLSIRPLSELVDMFHTRKATIPTDKVYALLGMSSDDPGASGLRAEYDTPWRIVFRKLITFCLSNQMSIETWDEKGVAIIKGKGYVLGKVSLVNGDIVCWKDRTGNSNMEERLPWEDITHISNTNEEQIHQFTLLASAKPVQQGDIICLLQGASKPTIIRPHNDYSTIIRIAAPFIGGSELATTDLLERLGLIMNFPGEFLLVWNWDSYPDQLQAGDYEDLMNGLGLLDQKIEPQKDLERALRLLEAGRIMESTGGGKRAIDNFGKSMQICDMAMRDANSLASRRTSWGAWGDFLVKYKGGWAPLPYAAQNGHQAAMQQLLDSGAAIETKDKDGRTALSWAAGNGQEAAIRELLNRGAAIEMKDKDGRTALSWAVGNGQEAAMRELLNKGASIEAKDKDGRTALSWAVGNGQEVAIRELLNRGAAIEMKDKDGRTALSWAAESGQEAAIRELLNKGAAIGTKDKDGRTALSWAAENGQKAVVRELLGRGAAIEAKDKDGRTALSWAAENGQEAVVRELLDRGAAIETKDRVNRTPLSWAAGNGHRTVLWCLLDKGAAIETKDFGGRTPLAWAAMGGKVVVVRLLLDRGPNIEAGEVSQGPPLLWAALYGHVAIVQLFLDRGAATKRSNTFRSTARDLAELNGHREVVKLLASHGARSTED